MRSPDPAGAAAVRIHDYLEHAGWRLRASTGLYTHPRGDAAYEARDALTLQAAVDTWTLNSVETLGPRIHRVEEYARV